MVPFQCFFQSQWQLHILLGLNVTNRFASNSTDHPCLAKDRPLQECHSWTSSASRPSCVYPWCRYSLSGSRTWQICHEKCDRNRWQWCQCCKSYPSCRASISIWLLSTHTKIHSRIFDCRALPSFTEMHSGVLKYLKEALPLVWKPNIPTDCRSLHLSRLICSREGRFRPMRLTTTTTLGPAVKRGWKVWRLLYRYVQIGCNLGSFIHSSNRSY